MQASAKISENNLCFLPLACPRFTQIINTHHTRLCSTSAVDRASELKCVERCYLMNPHCDGKNQFVRVCSRTETNINVFIYYVIICADHTLSAQCAWTFQA